MLMRQTSSLKKLEFFDFPLKKNVNFTSYTGAGHCLKKISEISCRSDTCEFFYQLSQVCRNLQSLNISFEKVTLKGLAELVSVQRNLKYLHIWQFIDYEDLKDVIESLSKIPNTLTKLNIYG